MLEEGEDERLIKVRKGVEALDEVGYRFEDVQEEVLAKSLK